MWYTVDINSNNAFAMEDNHLYDLMKQYVQEHKSLWRIKRNYIKEAKGHADTIVFWKKMQKAKEEDLIKLRGLIKKYLK